MLLHSLAFGSLKPFVGETAEDELNQKQIEMTSDVMAHSLVYWTQDFDAPQADRPRRPHLRDDQHGLVGRVEGVRRGERRPRPRSRPTSGSSPSSSAPLGITANAICAGVTDTPALRKIPDNDAMVQVALRKNPFTA